MRRLHLQADRHEDPRRAGAQVPGHRREGRPAEGGLVSGRDRILVADDDQASAELVLYFLQSHGFTVSTALDGNRALELGASGDFKVVILDVHMPMYDGVEVLQLLRKRHVLHPIKVIGLTGDLSDEVRQALELSGIDSFLTKPVDLALLRKEVDRLMAA
ncbi:MAG: response regulator [Chloroflexi bacterium]|nr:MAG: response regulator [Chloroflexota bacterium]TMF83609.1 MAG: response regulator [Chloroflexota bacterium]TMG11957.1 MAG: response regulator [Chloroflexota bacterium]TMG57791.1 MAG: response regulator [Chloroflexota bacterium]